MAGRSPAARLFIMADEFAAAGREAVPSLGAGHLPRAAGATIEERDMQEDTDLEAAWAAFCDRLKVAGRTVLRPEAPAADLDRAEGYRYLTRLLRAGLERSVEFADPDFPVFYALSHETIKIGSDNPDNVYRNAVISGDRRYRITGRLGNAELLSFGTKADGLSADGDILSTGEIDIGAMAVDADGRFELIVARDPQPGNWLPMTQASSMLLVRETHGPRTGRIPAEMTIACLDGPVRPRPLAAATLAAALEKTAAFVDVTAGVFADWMVRFQEQPNRFSEIDQAEWRRIGGDPAIFYLWGYWTLEPDEALLIESEVPACRYWNVQVNNYWDESLDYRHFQIHHNNRTARPEADGRVRILLSHQPMAGWNYVETAGHRCGAIMWRWVSADAHPIPRCQVVKRADLAPLPG
ncbi:hypothetical protein [Flavisphingomonas formosensis]|uniref:hypothetical protein n=1 Tax=Flavisphingomonas formosensis TaxID=861534 RepID=UPI001E3E184C|nr:hypothetical protein [Sphingomonas formosensis]